MGHKMGIDIFYAQSNVLSIILRLAWNHESYRTGYWAFDSVYLHRKISNKDRKCDLTC